jgi:hypothetical protein
MFAFGGGVQEVVLRFQILIKCSVYLMLNAVVAACGQENLS